MYLNVKFTCGSGLSVYAWVYVFFSTYRVMNISAWRIRIKVLLLFIRPVVSASLWTHGLQHARPFCPSPSPRVCPVHVHCISDAIQPSHHLMPSSPSALNLSLHQGLFQWVRWPKYWSFSFSLNPPSEYSGFISLKIDWFDLLAAQGAFRSLL